MFWKPAVVATVVVAAVSGCATLAPESPAPMPLVQQPTTLPASRRAANTSTCQHCGKQYQSRGRERAQGRKFCSNDCWSAANRVPLTCVQCGAEFTLPTSVVRQRGEPTCSLECRVARQRERHKKYMAGTCSICGGSTSKKTYKRCNACRVSGSEVPA
jgi:hypothetical protein